MWHFPIYGIPPYGGMRQGVPLCVDHTGGMGRFVPPVPLISGDFVYGARVFTPLQKRMYETFIHTVQRSVKIIPARMVSVSSYPQHGLHVTKPRFITHNRVCVYSLTHNRICM